MIDDSKVEDFLSHWGVLGMRWGVHKEQERRASFERRAKKYDAKAVKLQREIDVVSRIRIDPQYRDIRISELRRAKERAIKDAEAKRQGKLSSVQKKRIAVGTGVAVALAAYATYRVANSGEARRSIIKGTAFVKGEKVRPWKVNPELADPNLDADGILSKIVKKVNPKFGQPGTSQNCRRCTFAYELRRRGKDVAATRTTFGSGQAPAGMYNALEVRPGQKLLPAGKGYVHAFKAKRGEAPAIDALVKYGAWGKNAIEDAKPTGIFHALSKLPDGARGELGLGWGGRGGHSVAWEIVKGRPVIFDAQAGKSFKNATELTKFLDEKGLDIVKAGWTRLDDVALNDDFLLRWLKNVR